MYCDLFKIHPFNIYRQVLLYQMLIPIEHAYNPGMESSNNVKIHILNSLFIKLLYYYKI